MLSHSGFWEVSARLVCIFSSAGKGQKLRCRWGPTQRATVHRTVAFRWFKSVGTQFLQIKQLIPQNANRQKLVLVKYRLCRCEVMAYAIVKLCASRKVKLSLPTSPQGETSLRSSFTAGGNFTCPQGQT